MARLYNEWEIKNFSCWRGQICGVSLMTDFIVSPGIRDITLYPRGVEGNAEHLEVNMYDFENDDVTELSFIGSDGSVICTRQREAKSSRFSKCFTGPKFKEVVAGIRENEPLHEDRLILRWETRPGRISKRFLSVIDAYSAFFQIKPEMFGFEELGEIPKKLEFYTWKPISRIYFDYGKGNKPFVMVSACKTGSTLEDTRVNFKLVSVSRNYPAVITKKKVLARTSIWMLNGVNSIQKHEDDWIFVENENRILPYEFPLKELPGLTTIMCCKIITGKSCQSFCYSADFPLSPSIKITGFSTFCDMKSVGNAVTALTKDLTCLYQDHNFSDFEVRCGIVSFPTHRNILSARSPVLKAMVSGDMREAASGHVDVEDLDPYTVGRFLGFLYSGTSGDLEWEDALRLYYAADKYQVPSLKKECTAVLHASVSLENVCNILSLADRHQDKELRSVAHNFILKNYNEVLGSENWRKFMSSDSLLAVTTLTDFAKHKYVKRCDSN